MKTFLLGTMFGLIFSLLAVILFNFSPLTGLIQLNALVFVIGGGTMGGVLNLLLQKPSHAS